MKNKLLKLFQRLYILSNLVFSVVLNLLREFVSGTKETRKLVVFFIVHKTLEERHVIASLESIARQSYKANNMIDRFVIYNSNQKELSNDIIFNAINNLNISQYLNEVISFPYNPNCEKNLGSDISDIRKWSETHLNFRDVVMLFKADIILSKHYFRDLFQVFSKRFIFYFVTPFVLSKSRVSLPEIVKYSMRDNFISSDEITFFSESSDSSIPNDFESNAGRKDIYDENIEFISCTVKWDFSCHAFSVPLFKYVRIQYKSWGGINFFNLIPYFVNPVGSFTIHHYHGIISENRNDDREGPVKTWLDS